ncbi:unnamed protein product [Ectocarpus sp. 12 AP-2014]
MMSGLLAGTDMLPPRLLRLMGPAALLAAWVCTGDAAHTIGSGIGGSRTGLLRPLPSEVAVSESEDRATADDGRVRCYGRARSAWSLCARMRGGSMAENQGPTDYSSTLQDQSQPWWTDGKNKAKQKKQVRAAGGGASADKKRTAGSAVSSRTTSSSRTGLSLPSSSSATADLSLTGWAALLALPIVFLSGKYNADGSSGRAPTAVKAKPAATKKAKPPSQAVQKKKTPTAPKPKAKPKPKPAPAKRSGPPAASRGGGGVAGVVGGVLGKLVPDNAYLRSLLIIAIAALGSGGLHALTTNNLLRAAWPITLVDPWQVLAASAWALNMRATFGGGRLDGIGQSGSSGTRPVRFLSPAGWAFAIWGPIFFGEAVYVAFQLMPLPSIRGSWWLSDISPWFAGAMLFQALWCFSFRPWARDSGLLWLPALLLGGTGVALGGVHRILREAWFTSDMTVLQYLAVHVPLSLHFGWISCATLVNLNGYFATINKLSNRVKLGLALGSVVAAVALGVAITLLREDPIYAAVVAWALWAVGSPAGWDELRGRVEPGLIRTQQGIAKAGAVITAGAACTLVGLSLKDLVVGARGGDYDEDY